MVKLLVPLPDVLPRLRPPRQTTLLVTRQGTVPAPPALSAPAIIQASPACHAAGIRAPQPLDTRKAAPSAPFFALNPVWPCMACSVPLHWALRQMNCCHPDCPVPSALCPHNPVHVPHSPCVPNNNAPCVSGVYSMSSMRTDEWRGECWWLCGAAWLGEE